MKLKVVATGSTGNCYILSCEGRSILLDCGVSHRRILRSGCDLSKVECCLVTHEHGDHGFAAEKLSLYGVDVYATKGTFDGLKLDPTHNYNLHTVQTGVAFKSGQFTIVPFQVMHDANEPCGFLIRHGLTGETALYATDTYYLPNTFPGVHYWIIECNFIEERADDMVSDGTITQFMKMRLLRSHMSLRRLKDTLAANDLSQTRKIILVHMSDSRSDEHLMVQSFVQLTGIETVAAVSGLEIPLDLTPF